MAVHLPDFFNKAFERFAKDVTKYDLAEEAFQESGFVAKSDPENPDCFIFYYRDGARYRVPIKTVSKLTFDDYVERTFPCEVLKLN